ncbi:HNH/ENDO VII family nuclease [Capnocytophaga canimorsus]|uniref:HNH/ENDO VII family nuclease n=1 Tax=Capnocytophaga canimorsus TaxID=28188 RepID=UPI0037CE4858
MHLHHSRQQGKGPLFELSESTHLHTTNENGRKALHPFLPNKHPFDEVNRIAFNKVDKPEYWKQRAKAELEARKTKSH